jgi:hypothetical protein
MRPDAIAARAEVPFAVKWLIYDESDLAALAVRGANAHMGRLPGRTDEPEWTEIADLIRKLDAPQPAYEPRYYLEYPTPALALFWLGYAIQPRAGEAVPPPAVADSQHFGIAFHVPRTEAEQRVWAGLGAAVRFYVVVMAAALVGLMLVVGRGYEPGESWGGPVWLAALPGAVFFSLNRFDILPALATAVSFYCLGRGRRGWAGVWLAAGVLLKVYPVLFAPVVLRYLGPRAGLRWLAGFAGTAVAGFGLSVLLLDWEATVGPLRVQFSRPLEEGSWTLYGRLLPMDLGRDSTGRLAILALAVLAAVATRPADLSGVLRRCGVVLVVFVCLAVFWSPQWFVWFLPLVIPLARRRTLLLVPAVALDLLNYFAFPILFWMLWGPLEPDANQILAEVMIFVRAGVWLFLAGVLLRDEIVAWRRAEADRARASFRRDRAKLLEEFLGAAAATGRPRGVRWVTAEPAGEPVFVRDRDGQRLVALAPTLVQFEPEPGSELDDVPQAREPRTVTALFTFDGGAWRTAGRAVFNLSPHQVVERSGGRYEVVPGTDASGP